MDTTYGSSTINKGITGTGIKIIALVTMLLDHIGAVILESYLNVNLPGFADSSGKIDASSMPPSVYGIYILDIVLRLIGRFAFPLFVFLIVEGFKHTGSVKKYALNMLIFAFISEIPFNLAHGGTIINLETQSVYVTLLLGLLCIWVIRELAENKKWSANISFLYYLASMVLGASLMWFFTLTEVYSYIMHLFFDDKMISTPTLFVMCLIAAFVALIVMLFLSKKLDADGKNRFTFTVFITVVFSIAAYVLKCDYSAYGILSIVIMYLLRSDRMKAFFFMVLLLSIYSVAEVSAFFMLIVINKYNGLRGMKINKYFFYAFYPVHLLILYLITYLLGFLSFSWM